MKQIIISPQMIGSASILMFLVSCTTPPRIPTFSPVPASLTATTTPVTFLPTTIVLTPTRTPLAPPMSPEFPAGSFYHQHAASSFCVLVFRSDGTYAYYWFVPSVDVNESEPYVSGTYSIDGNLFIETSTTFPGCPSPVTYKWTYDGRKLLFQAAGEDTCSDRQRTYETPLAYIKVE
jgi:hypothetical protein